MTFDTSNLNAVATSATCERLQQYAAFISEPALIG
jgi:hypothetical protein